MYTISYTGMIRQGDTWIPSDPQNPDYQGYLKWVAQGNIAEVEPQPVLEAPTAVAELHVAIDAANLTDEQAALLKQVVELRKAP